MTDDPKHNRHGGPKLRNPSAVEPGDSVSSAAASTVPAWLQAVPFGLLVVRVDGVIEQINDAASRLLGYEPGELVGSGVERLVPMHMVARHRKLRVGFVGERNAAPMSRLRTIEARHKDGSSVAMHIELSRPWSEAPGRTLVTLRDMRTQIALEAKLHRLQRMENLGLMAAGTVHDFNNHLTSLELLCSMQPAGEPEWEDVRETTAQLRQLVTTLRRISRSEDEPVTVFDVVEVLTTHRRVFERLTDGSVATTFPAGAVLMRGKAQDLVQSVVNLLVNAMHAHREAGVSRPITLAIEPHSEQLVGISVIDSGVGMTTEQIKRACEPGVTSRGHRGGSGLGLAIVRSVVESHGGRLELHSRPGHGTTASMLLPCLQLAVMVG